MRPIPAGTACRLLKVGRSAYYAYLAGREAAQIRQEGEDELAGEIRQIHAESRGAYGAPRVTAVLRHGGRPVSRKKVERIMRERGIRGITRRRRRSLTKADTKAAPSPDLVGRDFTAAEPGTKLVSDITYLPTLAGWWYLATVIDLATREVIGYAMADHHRAELVVDALRMAAARGGLKEGCITHRRLPFRRGRVQPHSPAQAPRVRLRHPTRDQSSGDARPHSRSINTRCPSPGWNFTRVAPPSLGRSVVWER